jgi:hypothetical protein
MLGYIRGDCYSSKMIRQIRAGGHSGPRGSVEGFFPNLDGYPTYLNYCLPHLLSFYLLSTF